MFSHKNNKWGSKSKSGTSKSSSSFIVSNFNNLVDRGKYLSDGSATSLQDRFEQKTPSSTVPSRIPRSFARQHYWYKGTYTPGNITSSSTVPIANSFSFQASLLSEFTNLSAVFDQYAIVAAVCRFVPLSFTSTSSSTTPGLFLSVIDHDDSTALVSVGAAQEYPSLLETVQTVGQTRVVYPRIAVAAYSGAFTSFANQRSWVDCASSTVQHYGLKTLLTPSTTSTYILACEIDLIICFRDNH